MTVYDSDWYRDHVAKAERGNREHVARYDRSFNGVMAKAMADDDGDHDASAPVGDHHVSRLADLLVESGRFTDRGHALRHLTSHPDGVALVRTHKKDDTPMDRIEQFTNVMKSSGLQNFCKALIDNHSDGISEHELTEAATRYAKGLYPDLSGPAAFSRLYESDVTLRKAVQVAKAWPMLSLEPTVVVGPAATHAGVDNTAGSEAYQQLVKMAEQQRRAGETASQAFERVYLDPANRHLAEGERSGNRPKPTTVFPMPR
jgi:hypothetical protein